MCHGNQFSVRKSNPITLPASRYKARALTIELNVQRMTKKSVLQRQKGAVLCHKITDARVH